MSRFRIVSLIICLIVIGTASELSAQQPQHFDHELHPQLDFDFQSLELDLGVQPQNLRIDGAANYQLKANVSGADTVTLYAAHMDIKNVTVDGNSADFSLHNDSLFIPLEKPAEAGEEYKLSVRYSGNPSFGLLKNANGTVWTSQLPQSQRHWVPIVDNPHVDFQTTLNISVPSGIQVWATGRKTGEEAASVEVMRYHFSSEKEVPALDLAFGLGKFESRSTSYGIKKINLAVEQSLTDTVDQQQLLQKAYDYLGQAEDHFKLEYPYRQLSVVVTDDHQWETKSWAASTIFLHRNRGDLEAQLLRGIIGQWFGSFQRAEQWKQSDALTLYQALAYHSLADSTLSLQKKNTPDKSFPTAYDGYGVDHWNRWLNYWENEQNENDPNKSVLQNAQNKILNELPAVVDWNDFAEYWYRQSGQPIFETPDITKANDSLKRSSSQPADSIAYKVIYSLNEAEGQLKLNFEAVHGVYKELTSINAFEVYPNKTDTSEVTFTGAQDSVMLQVNKMIQTLQLEAPDRAKLYLDEYKPTPFLIHELRNAQQTKDRAEAARKLGYHAGNPDLQLAIKDFMSGEVEPKVRAALLSSLADITQGAAGTEDTFLNALDSKHRSIRDAALMALQNYQDNDEVLSRVQQVAENADNIDLFRKAMQVLTAIGSSDQFETFVDGVTQQDSVGTRSVFAIQQLANRGEVEQAVTKAGLFTSDEFDYRVRSRALNILIQHDHTPSDWLARAEDLLQSSDPRIRFLVIRGLEKNKNQEITDFLSAYIQDEYDARVYRKIEQLIRDE